MATDHDPILAGGRTPLPIACTLGPDDGPARLARWARLAAAAAPVTHRAGHVLEVRYQPGDGVRAELAALAAAESSCCGFVTWAVTAADPPTLRVTADPASPADLDPIAALFGAG